MNFINFIAPSTQPRIWLGLGVILWTFILGNAWGFFVRGKLFNRPIDAYSDFDTSRVGLGAFGTLFIFLWGLLIPLVLIQYHRFTAYGMWWQIWICSFSLGAMSGYSLGKRFWKTKVVPLKGGLVATEEGLLIVSPEDHRNDFV